MHHGQSIRPVDLLVVILFATHYLGYPQYHNARQVHGSKTNNQHPENPEHSGLYQAHAERIIPFLDASLPEDYLGNIQEILLTEASFRYYPGLTTAAQNDAQIVQNVDQQACV